MKRKILKVMSNVRRTLIGMDQPRKNNKNHYDEYYLEKILMG